RGHTILFDDEDPVRFQFDNGQISVTIRAAFERTHDEPIAPQMITIPVKIAVEGENLVLDAGPISIAPVIPPQNVARQLLHEGVIIKRIEASLPQRRLNRKFSLPLQRGEELSLGVTQVTVADGWLTVTLD